MTDLVARIGNLAAAATEGGGISDRKNIEFWLALADSWPRIAELLTEATAVQADNETLRVDVARWRQVAVIYAPNWLEAQDCYRSMEDAAARLAASTPDTARES